MCDVVCFGVFPAVYLYFNGVNSVFGVALLVFYVLCAVIRLSFFNVLEAKRQKTEGGSNKVYRGLPVTSISCILPMAFWLQFLMSDMAFLVLLHVLLAVVGFLFILDFKLPKPGLKQILIMIAAMGITVAIIFAFTRYRLPDQKNESNPIVDGIMGEIYETENP
jgi:CDP-diacylglycerol--serine O-phosphatidyltransferase